LRGSRFCVVWREDKSLVALETWPRDNEITTTDNTKIGETTWRICNNSKNKS
jgi:hypothetical protein